jgi:hypothetical protein
LEEPLERGEIIHFPVCPFRLPEGDDHRFLLEQRLGGRIHKNISYDPNTGKAAGYLHQSTEQAERLRGILRSFAESATTWLARTLPRYARSWQRDRVSYRPAEEATRKMRLTARNDLLHVDAFPSRPTRGQRILRLFANVNPTEPRIWVTSDPFAKLLSRFADEVGLPAGHSATWFHRLRQNMLGLFAKSRRQRTVYDSFMLRFHDFLKANDEFQERAPKRFWNFQPGSAWMVFTDTASHAVLRGRFALEHSYFVSPKDLKLPAESPPALLERACRLPVLDQAA